MKTTTVFGAFVVGSCVNVSIQAQECSGLPTHSELQAALSQAQSMNNGGFGLNMWGTLVNRDGIVCAVAFTGADRGAQWPGSRVISAQKANTANAFGLPQQALASGNFYSAAQPGGFAYGLQQGNPINIEVAYAGPARAYGQADDPMVGRRIGGTNVFGGGLALYDANHTLVGGLGVSGDTSCADHNIAWRTRHFLALDYVPGGVNSPYDAQRPDNLIYDITPQPGQMPGISASGWGHPRCGNTEDIVAKTLPPVSH